MNKHWACVAVEGGFEPVKSQKFGWAMPSKTLIYHTISFDSTGRWSYSSSGLPHMEGGSLTEGETTHGNHSRNGYG
jgi:hypothetical protein